LILHRDVLHNRDVYRALEQKIDVDKIRKEIPQVATERSDDVRGLENLAVIAGTIGVASFFAFELLGMSGHDALPRALLIGLSDWTLPWSLAYARLGGPFHA